MKTKTGGEIAGGLLTLAMLVFFLLAISLIVVKEGAAHKPDKVQPASTTPTFAAGMSSSR